ncbi:UDP-N-acetylmuramate--L-alanine ligase [Pendulispora albinea]|uniref:Mur ligase domain-containing protein n=1 Tax=Pendulispora albinea TaxID=2741071 RepID=A0ABZ2LX84_9BACT
MSNVVHLVGISGTGMGALAMLFRELGWEVRGSDLAFDPPIGPALEAAGVTCLRGYAAEHVAGELDLVVVGNAIRRDNVEATAVRERGLRALSMSAALREYFLTGRRPLVVTGTHGKTTTSAMSAWICASADLEPGYFIGGLPKNFPSGAAVGSLRRKIVGGSAPPAPFVIEGDEYDAVYWHKEPKFFDYVGVGEDDVVIVTGIEHDHIDIYPDEASYVAQFAKLAAKVPEAGLIVCDASQHLAVRTLQEHARARLVFYALEGDDTGELTPTWLAAPAPIDAGGMQPFDLFVGGMSCGRFAMKSPGAHNVRDAVAALCACAEGFRVPVLRARTGLATFEGVRRRQDLLGAPRGISVYDDFAHHPTAVEETLAALRAKQKAAHAEQTGGRLWAVFEPRSATACRALHQQAYARAFGSADLVLLAPLGRANVPAGERLDLELLARDIGDKAEAMPSVDAILERLAAEARPGDAIALLSNGAFGGLHSRLLARLTP